MSLTAYQHPVSYLFDVDLAVNKASETVNLPLPTRDALWFVRAISMVQSQNLQLEVMLFTRAVNLGGSLDPNTDCFNAAWMFGLAAAGPPATYDYPVDPLDISPADTFYHKYVDGNSMPIWDLDQLDASRAAGTYPANANLHVRLVNRNASTLNTPVLVTFYCAPQGAQA